MPQRSWLCGTKNYDPNKSFSGHDLCQAKRLSKAGCLAQGNSVHRGAIIAAKIRNTGALTQTGTVDQSDYVNISQVPNVRVLPLGTDNFGRDVLTELVKATGVSLEIGLVAGLIATLIGLTLGLLAGYIGGLVDDIIMFVTNIFTVIPTFVLLILISFSIGQDKRGAFTIAMVIGFTSWVWTARAVRSQVISLRNRDHVNLSKLSGHSIAHIIVDRYPALHRFLCGHGVDPADLLGHPGGGGLVDPWVGTQNHRSANPGFDDELGDDLPGGDPGQMVGILPRAPHHCPDHILDEFDEYRPRPGIQSGVEGLGDDMAKVMLEVKELTTKYITRFREDVYAVDHVSLKVEEGKSLGIAGESGCGKSTLALSLMGYYFRSAALYQRRDHHRRAQYIPGWIRMRFVDRSWARRLPISPKPP